MNRLNRIRTSVRQKRRTNRQPVEYAPLFFDALKGRAGALLMAMTDHPIATDPALDGRLSVRGHARREARMNRKLIKRGLLRYQP